MLLGDLVAKAVPKLVVEPRVVLKVELVVVCFRRVEHFAKVKNVVVFVEFEFPCFTTSRADFPFGWAFHQDLADLGEDSKKDCLQNCLSFRLDLADLEEDSKKDYRRHRLLLHPALIVRKDCFHLGQTWLLD